MRILLSNGKGLGFRVVWGLGFRDIALVIIIIINSQTPMPILKQQKYTKAGSLPMIADCPNCAAHPCFINPQNAAGLWAMSKSCTTRNKQYTIIPIV